MSDSPVDSSKRTWIITSACAGAVGGVATAVPFVSSFQPSEKAKAAGAAVEVDISSLKDGEKLTVEWRGKPVWIIKRTPEQLKDLPGLDGELADPKSVRHPEEFTPPYAQNEARSIKPEILVVVGICTHLGCSPSDKFVAGPQPSLPADWKGVPVPLPWFHLRHGRPGVQEQASAGQPAGAATYVSVRHQAADW